MNLLIGNEVCFSFYLVSLPLHLQSYSFQKWISRAWNGNFEGVLWTLGHAHVKMWELLIAFIAALFPLHEKCWFEVWQQPPAHPSCCGEVSAAVHCCYTGAEGLQVFIIPTALQLNVCVCVSLPLGQLKPQMSWKWISSFEPWLLWVIHMSQASSASLKLLSWE